MLSLTDTVIIVLLVVFILMEGHGVLKGRKQTVVGGLLPFFFFNSDHSMITQLDTEKKLI